VPGETPERDTHLWDRAALVFGLLGLAVAVALCVRGLVPALPGRDRPPVGSLAQPVNGVWRPTGMAPSEGGLLVNVAEAVRAGQAELSSPHGAAVGPDEFLDVRPLTITDTNDPDRGWAGTSSREWLYEHPPSSVTVEVALPANQEVWLDASLAIDPAVWNSPTGDGVEFVASVAAVDRRGQAGPESVVVDRDFNPRSKGEQHKWVPVSADLSRWSGSTIRVTLRTLPREDTTYDWAGWGNPVIYVRDSARARMG
jgi:hypothetical protein